MLLSDGEFNRMFDEQRGDDLFDRQFVVIRQAVNLFPILEQFLVEHLRLAFGFVEKQFVRRDIERESHLSDDFERRLRAVAFVIGEHRNVNADKFA